MTMEPQGAFGPFEIVREIESTGGATVYRAKKEGDPKGAYALKLFSPERLAAEQAPEDATTLDPLFRDLGASFVKSVNLQKKAAESSPLFAPILAGGQDERGAWYATLFYPRTIKGLLELFTAFDGPDIFHVVDSVTKAALHLKRTCGRSHGNLKPSNIFLAGVGKARASTVVVADPLAGDAKEARRYEAADLRAIGQLLCQLVFRRTIDFMKGIVAVETSGEWGPVFGKQAAIWQQLCSRLLDSNLNPESFPLERLEEELRALKPKRSIALTVAPIAGAIVVVGGVAAFFIFSKSTKGTLSVRIDPPRSQVIVFALDDINRPIQNSGVTNSAETGNLTIKLEAGKYRVRPEYHSAYGDLDSARIFKDLEIKAGAKETADFKLPYGGLIVRSEPPGALIEINHQKLPTPFTNAYARPAAIDLKLELAGHETTNVSGIITSNGWLVLSATLAKVKAGEVLVDFKSDPPGAEVSIDGERAFVTDYSKRVTEDDSHRVEAVFRAWPVPEQATTNFTLQLSRRNGETQQRFMRFAHGTVALQGQPDGAEVRINGRLAGTMPTNIFLPPGSFTIDVTSPGYSSFKTNLIVADAQAFSFSPALVALDGFVELISDPPGAEIRDDTGRLLTNTAAEMIQLPLRPGSYNLKATLGDLDPVVRKAVVRAGQTNQPDPFNFTYGTVIFTNIQPPNATISRAGVKIEPNKPTYQRLDTVAYSIDAANYQPVQTNVFLAANERKPSRQVSVSLARNKVSLTLVSDPAGAQFFLADGTPLAGNGPNYPLPWGPATVIARYAKFPRLGDITNAVDIKPTGENQSRFDFQYGTLVLTNLPTRVTVSEGGQRVGSAADRAVYEKIGRHEYFLKRESGSETIITNILANLPNYLITTLTNKPGWQSINGIDLALVSNLLGPGKDGYVSKYEVTQTQYEQIASTNHPNRSAVRGADLPVSNISAADAEDFCDRLTEADKARPDFPPNHRYRLPTEQQWEFFAAGTSTNGAVLSESFAKPRPGPEIVGSGQVPNQFGLFDILGNVWEICRSPDKSNFVLFGGCYNSSIKVFPASFTVPLTDAESRFVRSPYNGPLPQVGIRIILIPAEAD